MFYFDYDYENNLYKIFKLFKCSVFFMIKNLNNDRNNKLWVFADEKTSFIKLNDF